MSVTRIMSGVAAHNAEQNQQIRKSLAEALQILMSQKEYNSISISELCKKAGVSRTAFYNNFSTLSDVFEEVARTFITEINEKITPLQAHNSLEWYENFFRLVEQNSQSYLTIRKAGFQGKYLEITNDIILAHDRLTEKEMETTCIQRSCAEYGVPLDGGRNERTHRADSKMGLGSVGATINQARRTARKIRGSF